MITQLGPNKTELFGRIILQIMLLLFLSRFVLVIIHPTGKHIFQEQKEWDWLFGSCLLIINIGFFLQLYFIPFWVIIDDKRKIVEVKYLFSKSKFIELKNIVAYGTTTIKFRSTIYYGILLYLPNEKEILFSDLNLADYTPIELFISSLNIKKNAEKKFSFLSYYSRQ